MPDSVSHDTISRDEILSRRADPSFVLVNVLPKAAFAKQRIPGSVNLPIAEIHTHAADVLPARDREIAVHCTGPT